MSTKSKPPIMMSKQKIPDSHHQVSKPYIAQSKTPVIQPAVRRPVAPPVYRPQPVPKVLQTKTVQKNSTPGISLGNNRNSPFAAAKHSLSKIVPAKMPVAQAKRISAASPAYRPQAIPKVLQTKTIQKHNAPTAVSGGNQNFPATTAKSLSPTVVQLTKGKGGGKKAREKMKQARAQAARAEQTGRGVLSTCYSWSGGVWKWRAQATPSDDNKHPHAEEKCFAASKIKEGWVGFVQNAWPCIEEENSCTATFKAESKKGFSFVFKITGDVGGYAANHGVAAAGGELWIINGVASYKKPELPAGSPANPPG